MVDFPFPLDENQEPVPEEFQAKPNVQATEQKSAEQSQSEQQEAGVAEDQQAVSEQVGEIPLEQWKRAVDLIISESGPPQEYVPPERIPPPPPKDFERYISDPDYAAKYDQMVLLYQHAMLQAIREEMRASVRSAINEAMKATIRERGAEAFSWAASQYLDLFQTEDQKQVLQSAILDARQAVNKNPALAADKGFWAATFAMAAARAGIPLRQPERVSSQPPRPFGPGGKPAPQEQYTLSDEERRLAAQFGLTEEEWIKNMKEAGRL
jgi:hypothetical protein